MNKKLTASLVIASVFIQSASFAQIQSPLHDAQENRIDIRILDNILNQNDPEAEKELSECMMSDSSYNDEGSMSALNDILQLTKQLNATETISQDELKKIYQANGCNTDVVDQEIPKKRINSLVGFNIESVRRKSTTPESVLFEKITTAGEKKKKREDLALESCRKRKLFEDVEGCQPVRNMQKAIQDGKFTSRDLRAIRQNRLKDNANLIGVAAVGGLAVAIWQAYISERSYQLEKQKYLDLKQEKQEASKKNEETKGDSPRTTNDKPQKQPPSASQASSKEDEHKPDARQANAIRENGVKHATPLNDVRTSINPVVDEDLQINDQIFSQFKSEVEDKVKSCDSKKRARISGDTYSNPGNQGIINTRTSVDLKKPSGACNYEQLKKDLTTKERDSFRCDDPYSNCSMQLDKQFRQDQLKLEQVQAANRRCAILNGGTTEQLKQECAEVKKILFELLSGTSSDSFIGPELKKFDEEQKNAPFNFNEALKNFEEFRNKYNKGPANGNLSI